MYRYKYIQNHCTPKGGLSLCVMFRVYFCLFKTLNFCLWETKEIWRTRLLDICFRKKGVPVLISKETRMIKLVAAKVRYMFSKNLLRFCHHHLRRRRGVFCVESPLKRRRRRRSDENRVCVMSLVVWSSSSSHLETNVEDDAKERSTLSLACATKTRPTPLPIVL